MPAPFPIRAYIIYVSAGNTLKSQFLYGFHMEEPLVIGQSQNGGRVFLYSRNFLLVNFTNLIGKSDRSCTSLWLYTPRSIQSVRSTNESLVKFTNRKFLECVPCSFDLNRCLLLKKVDFCHNWAFSYEKRGLQKSAGYLWSAASIVKTSYPYSVRERGKHPRIAIFVWISYGREIGNWIETRNSGGVFPLHSFHIQCA